MESPEFYQQGDVIVERIASVPAGEAVPPEKGKLILAKGELTGHTHAIEDIAGVAFVKGTDGNFYLSLPAERTLVHQEHRPIVIPAGLYRVRQVREYDHFTEEARRVCE